MTKTPLLSIVTINKNDEYQKNQIKRTKFILNYFIYSLKKMNALNKVEYIIVDWGSKEPLSNYFYDEISKCSAIKFINIPEKETKKSKLNFDHSKASDIGINSSSGEHVMLTGSDQFFPLSVFNNMLNILEKPETFGISGDEYKLVPRKFLQDDFFIYDENMEKVDQYFQKLSHSMLPLAPDFQMNDGSGAGGTILKKKQWSQIGGIKDTEQHNRGQDLVIFHETSEICSHIDTATFGFFLLKLPRSESGFRQTHIKKLKNPLNYLKFDKDESLINSKNIEIVSSLNLPKKKLNIEEQLSLKKEQDLTIKEIIKTTIECSIFTVFSKINLKSQDIFFILNMKSIIETNKLKNVILDEAQSLRFISYLSSYFPDMTFFIITESKKYTPLELLKLRNAFVCRTKIHRHYGYVKLLNFDHYDFESIKKYQNCCIIQDFSSNTNKLPFFKKIISSIKISAIRKLNDNSKTISYDIEKEFSFEQKKSKLLRSSIAINFLIHSLVVFFKIKRIFGNIRRMFTN